MRGTDVGTNAYSVTVQPCKHVLYVFETLLSLINARHRCDGDGCNFAETLISLTNAWCRCWHMSAIFLRKGILLNHVTVALSLSLELKSYSLDLHFEWSSISILTAHIFVARCWVIPKAQREWRDITAAVAMAPKCTFLCFKIFRTRTSLLA